MTRLRPCTACGRHIRISEKACPFCVSTELTSTAPLRISALLLGLCLAACTSGKDEVEPGVESAPKPASSKVEVEVVEEIDDTAKPMQEEPEDSGEPEDSAALEPVDTLEPSDTAEPEEPEPEVPIVEGTDAGDTLVDPPAHKPPHAEPEPRPKKTYGAPPNKRVEKLEEI